MKKADLKKGIPPLASKTRLGRNDKRKTVSATPTAMVENKSMVRCPECHVAINIEGGEIGDYLECETCFAELILASLEPPRLELVDEEK
jgi:lysine biosynthesis protein LysW